MTYEDENAGPAAGDYGVRAPAPDAAPAAAARPAGMPRRPPPRSAEVERVMRREFDVIIEGAKLRLPLGEAIMLQLAHRALRGETWAVKHLVKLMGDTEKTRAAQDAARAKREVERARNNARIRERREDAAANAERRAAEREAATLKARAAAAWAREDAERDSECRRRRTERVEAERLQTERLAREAAVARELVRLKVLTLSHEPDEPGALQPWAVEAARVRDPERWAGLDAAQRQAVELAQTEPDSVLDEMDWEDADDADTLEERLLRDDARCRAVFRTLEILGLVEGRFGDDSAPVMLAPWVLQAAADGSMSNQPGIV